MIPHAPHSHRDIADETGATALGPLPDWDLSDLYPTVNAPELTRDLAWLEDECTNFAATYETKLGELDAAALLVCVQRYERIDMIAGRIM